MLCHKTIFQCMILFSVIFNLKIMNNLLDLKGVGPEIIIKLNRLGIDQPLDLLFHLPRSYQDRTQIHSIKTLVMGQEVMIEGEILNAKVIHARQRILICHIADNTGTMTCRFFHFHQQQYKQMTPGCKIRCFGEIRYGREGIEMTHPEYRIVHDGVTLPLSNRLTPIYPITEGLSQQRIRQCVEQVMESCDTLDLKELLPETTRHELQLPALLEAIRFIHQPPPTEKQQTLLDGIHPMQQRLAFEELLAHRLGLIQRRLQSQITPAFSLPTSQTLQAKLIQQLPFSLTSAQQRVVTEISKDLMKPQAMMRLLQGDVGSGKTLVAVMAILQTIEAGHQAAIMAPTEILAEQHFNNFSRWLDKLEIKTVWLASKLPTKTKQQAYEKIASGDAQVVVGTHALFQPDVNYHNLALVVIDEQHRFGVEQRLALQHKGEQAGYLPHQLIMTATPIPRTLAMTAYADLDLSTIDEMPPGRTPVKTILIANNRRADIIQRVNAQCLEGHQAYWVCPLIEESEILNCENAEKTFATLQAELSNLNIGLVHGRMTPKQKTEIMAQFKANTIHVLVATTVIEVGVDIPNASLMIIENAERLGLAQLHQLRGRVGRGSIESFCTLMYQNPLSQRARLRLQTIKQHNNGFKVAEQDLKIRGPGEVLGTKQTGDISFKIADIMRDQTLIPQVQKVADDIIAHRPELIDQLIDRWIGKKQEYALV